MLKRKSEEGRSTSRISSVFSSSSLKLRTAAGFSCEKQQTKKLSQKKKKKREREELLTGFGYACSRESDKII
jgi:hypothetical protein